MQLPIVTIEPSEDILDEPRTLVQFTLTEHDGTQTISPIGIEYRGGYSQSYDKKSMRIEFWDDATGDDTSNVSLLDMRSDDDWSLQAMYNQSLHLRSKSAFDLWGEIDTLCYIDQEPEPVNGVHYEYIEVFINDGYRGVYGLSERVDHKQLRLKKEYEGIIRGELYKEI